MPERPTKSGLGWNPIRVVNYTVYAVVALLIAAAVYHAIPPSHITIETGPVGGSYYEDALEYQQELKARGIAVTLHANPQSREIINHVEAATDGLRVGFVELAVDRNKFPNTRSLGAIELQPLFIFYAAKIGDIDTPNGLRGHRIVVPPERSATADAALRLLRHYEVTPENTQISFLPIAEAVKALIAGRFDAGFFLLAPRNEFIRRLAADRDLRLLDMPDATALSRLDPYLRMVVLPHGVYDIENNVPPRNVRMLAATVNVVARRNLPPAILYPLLEVMADVHHHSSLINNAGEFPNLVDVSLPADPLAKQYEKSGVPWTYQNLPAWIANMINSYFVIGVVFVVLIEGYRSFHYLMELMDFLLEHLCLRLLTTIERRHRKGRALGSFDLKLVDMAESALFRTSRRRRSEDLIGRIRQHGR